MPLDKLITVLDDQVHALEEENRAKGKEAVVTRVLKPEPRPALHAPRRGWQAAA